VRKKGEWDACEVASKKGKSLSKGDVFGKNGKLWLEETDEF